MPDLKISELPAAASLADGDVAPLTQGLGTPVTRRASLAQIRAHVLAERGVHVRDFGAAGNGTADDGPALQAAINALGAAGGVVHLGARTYRIGTPVVVTGGAVRLQGQGFSEGGNPGEGTWLTCTTPGLFPLTFTGIAARGSAVRDLAVREAHTASMTGSWAPTPYEWFFRVLDCLGGVDFDNVMLSPVNKGILVRNSGRTDIRRLRGQCFTTGVEYDEIYDVVRIASLHLWPFWSANDNVLRWQQANHDSLVFRRVDGVFVDQAFTLGARAMFRFGASAAGYTQKFSIGQAYADFVRHGIWIEAANTDGQVDAMTVQCELWNGGGAHLPGSVGILLGASNARVQLGQLRVDDVEDHAIRVEGAGNRLDIGALRVVNFNQRNNGAAAVHVAHVASGTPNRVLLPSAPLLEGVTNNGPAVNPGTNASFGLVTPAGSPARPALAVGAADAGLSLPAANALAASVAGAEALRLAPGSATLGGPAGAHGFEVATPAGAANRLRAQGGAAGAAPALQAAGADANLELVLEGKGSGGVLLRSGAGTQAVVAHVPSAVNFVQLAGGATGAPGRVGIQAAGADAHVGLVLSPKGNGALTAAAPDATAAGGNARGANAVDWQQTRSSAGRVASGANATLGGGRNNTASGADSTVAGGDNCSATASRSTVGGGNDNAATALQATVAGGFNNAASGVSSAIGGGSSNVASGQWSAIPGGAAASTRGHVGRIAFGGGASFGAAGDAQLGEFLLARVTTDGAAARLTADNAAPGAANTLNLPNNGTSRLKLMVVAQQTAGTAGTVGDSASWEVNVLLRRGGSAATTAFVGGTAFAGAALAAVTPGTGFAAGLRDAGAAAWLLTLAADTANGGLAVSATGEANKTIRWVCRVLSVEVAA
ncbi:hypothetical protein ACI6QG_03010 [Roseococcus sp. DSY-14]|uniref:hypothetical protein n=1 Tax=Roseococcus sp. DSY-14 TaxID=3369650 RepID=UPI00387AAD37